MARPATVAAQSAGSRGRRGAPTQPGAGADRSGDPGSVPTSIAFLGPEGTFTEEALLSQEDYASAHLVPMMSMPDVLDAVCRGAVDLGFAPIENSIEGTVTATVDSLVFDVDLLIQREVILDVHVDLLGVPGAGLDGIERVLSFPHAAGQCRRFLADRLGSAQVVPTTSTAEAARLVAEAGDPAAVALAPGLAARLYGLEIFAEAVEDHPDNQTRFVSVASSGIPAPSGHDKTSIVCFQHEDRPGSLHGILSEFAARGINLVKLESRPSKQGLGSYCFLIDLEGHLADEVVADCLGVLHAELAGVKFLGSYPIAGEEGHVARERAGTAWREAQGWLEQLKGQIRPL